MEKYHLKLIKPIKNTHLFNKNQKCWVIYCQGDNSLFVKGKHRGKNRYIPAWLHERDYDPSTFQLIEVSKEFYEKIMENY
jgi:hypothetical protein